MNGDEVGPPRLPCDPVSGRPKPTTEALRVGRDRNNKVGRLRRSLLLNHDQLAIFNAEAGDVVREFEAGAGLRLGELVLEGRVEHGDGYGEIADLELGRLEGDITIGSAQLAGDGHVDIFAVQVGDELADDAVAGKGDLAETAGIFERGADFVGGEARLRGLTTLMRLFKVIPLGLKLRVLRAGERRRHGFGNHGGTLEHQP
jgi:hypothetical protein